MTRETMVFYKSYLEAVRELPPEEFKECLMTILNYGFDGIEPETSNAQVKMYFSLIKPQIDANNVKYLNGCKGGAPLGNQNARKYPIETSENNQKQPKNNQKQRNDNVNDNVNVNDNDKYIKRENKKEKKITRFHVFNESHYDFDALERESGIK